MKPNEGRFLKAVTQVCSLLTAGFGLLALLGWLLGMPVLSSFGMGLIQMAPITALLFGLLGSALFLYVRRPESRVTRWIALVIGAFSAFVSLVLLVLSSLGYRLDVEQLGILTSGLLDDTLSGNMSPATAGSFLLASVLLLLLFLPSGGKRRQAIAAQGIALLIILVNYVFILAYIIGLPMFYGGNTIPPAAPTNLAFLAFGAALLARSRTQTNPSDKPAEALPANISYTILLVFVVLALTIITIGYRYYQNYTRHYRIEVERELSAVADLKVSGLESWLTERLGDAEVLRQNTASTALVQDYLANPGEPQIEEKFQSWLDTIRKSYTYDRVSLLDTAGAVQISSPPAAQPVTANLAGAISQSLESGQIIFLDFQRYEDDSIHLLLLIPIYTEPDRDQPMGMMVLDMVPETYLYPYLSQWPSRSATAETLLIRREGEDALFLSPLRFEPDAALHVRIPVTKTDSLAVKAVLGESGIVEGVDYRGNAVIGDVRPVPDSPWYLATYINTAEVIAPLRERLWQTVIFFSALVVSTGAGLALAWRQQRLRFYRTQIQAAEALRDSGTRFRRLHESMMDCFVQVNMAGEIVNVNPAYLDMLGYSEAEVYKLHYQDITPQHWLSFENEIVEKQILPRGHSDIYEKEYIKKDGTIIPVELRTFLLQDNARQPSGMWAIVRDLTERKRAENRIKVYIHFLESLEIIDKVIGQETNIDQLLKNVMERVFGIFECDRAWLFYPCDPETPTFRIPIEISRPEYPGANALNLDVPMDAGVANDLREALASENPVSYRLGTEKPVNPLTAQQFAVQAQLIMAIYPKIGKPWVFGMHQCSYPRIWTEDEIVLFKEIGRRVADGLSNVLLFRDLSESEERFRTLVTQAADAIFLHDMGQGRLLSVNQRACDTLGYTKGELLEMKVADIDAEFISQDHVSTYWSQLSRDHPVTLESRHKRKDGTTFPVEVRLGLLQIEGKLSILALARDITERKQAEDALKEYNSRLEIAVEARTRELREAQEQLVRQERLAVLGQLAGGVGHELRNPLTVILTAIYYLKLVQPDADEQIKKYLIMIEKEARTAEKIVSDLLDFARNKSANREPAAVSTLVRSVLERYPVPSSVNVTLELPSNLPPVYIDPRQIEQVLGNLVVNACQAMPDGGKLLLSAGMKGEMAVIAVTDTGTGISPENMRRLFEPLFTTKTKGIGLGLAVSQRLAEANGGRIEVQSESGKGSTFTVSLPVYSTMKIGGHDG